MALSRTLLITRARTFAAPVPAATAWLLADCMQCRGRQELWQGRKRETLDTLRERAMVQSVESSNRIEGVIVDSARLKPLVMGKARPRDRSEEELAGYRRALAWIFKSGTKAPIRAQTIKHLHSLAQEGVQDAGVLKSKDNEIIEFLPNGRTARPLPADVRQADCRCGEGAVCRVRRLPRAAACAGLAVDRQLRVRFSLHPSLPRWQWARRAAVDDAAA